MSRITLYTSYHHLANILDETTEKPKERNVMAFSHFRWIEERKELQDRIFEYRSSPMTVKVSVDEKDVEQISDEEGVCQINNVSSIEVFENPLLEMQGTFSLDFNKVENNKSKKELLADAIEFLSEEELKKVLAFSMEYIQRNIIEDLEDNLTLYNFRDKEEKEINNTINENKDLYNRLDDVLNK